MAILEINSTEFKKEVNEEKDNIVLVDFWAPWCGPCKALAPILEELDKEMGNKIKIAKINVDNNPETASKYGIMSIPTLMIFKEGKMIAKISGLKSKDQLISWIKEHTSN